MSIAMILYSDSTGPDRSPGGARPFNRLGRFLFSLELRPLRLSTSCVSIERSGITPFPVSESAVSQADGAA
jgi:hypothetical protein